MMRSISRHVVVVTLFRSIAALALIASIAVGSVHHHAGATDRHSCPVCTAAGTVAVAADPAPRPEPPLKPLRPLLAPTMVANSSPCICRADARAPPAC
jgi:hypothetical protein